MKLAFEAPRTSVPERTRLYPNPQKKLHMVFSHEDFGVYVGTSPGAPCLEGTYDRFSYEEMLAEVRVMAANGPHPGAVLFWGTKSECEYYRENLE